MQVEELHKNGQRIKLNIAINGPEVTSVSSESREATVAYLGFLRLLAILEEYEIKLRDLQVYM